MKLKMFFAMASMSCLLSLDVLAADACVPVSSRISFSRDSFFCSNKIPPAGQAFSSDIKAAKTDLEAQCKKIAQSRKSNFERLGKNSKCEKYKKFDSEDIKFQFKKPSSCTMTASAYCKLK